MENIKLEDLIGKWYINMTNFPMWLKGNKTRPTFNYSIAHRGKTKGLRDEVQFIKNEKSKSINGFDTPLNKENTAFEWRGDGWMSVLRSRWKILHLDKSEQWAIIFFEKTLFTPEGYDVISRKRKLEDWKRKKVEEQLKKLEVVAELVELQIDHN